MKKLFVTVLIFVGPSFFSTGQAFAHAQVTDSFPKFNSTVKSIPAEVWIEFDGNLLELGPKQINSLVVKDKGGARLDTGESQVAGARIYAKIANKSVGGKVTLTYRVVSEDGHPVSGSVTFEVMSTQTPASLGSTQGSGGDNAKNESSIIGGTESQGDASHHNFVHRHSLHIYEFLFASMAIITWGFYRKIRSKKRE